MPAKINASHVKRGHPHHAKIQPCQHQPRTKDNDKTKNRLSSRDSCSAEDDNAIRALFVPARRSRDDSHQPRAATAMAPKPSSALCQGSFFDSLFFCHEMTTTPSSVVSLITAASITSLGKRCPSDNNSIWQIVRRMCHNRVIVIIRPVPSNSLSFNGQEQI